LGLVLLWFPEKKDWMVEGKELYVSLRPEKILISTKETDGFSNHVTGSVESIVYQGRSTQYNVRLKNDYLIHVFEQNEEHFIRDTIDYGTHVHLYWQKENAVVLER
jgi:ABC-type Fe3+/spermidine/putrescine transport system ATPase subunit